MDLQELQALRHATFDVVERGAQRRGDTVDGRSKRLWGMGKLALD